MKIIICEGITEVTLAYYLNEKINQNYEIDKLKDIKSSPEKIIEGCYLINAQGVDKLKAIVSKLLKMPKRKDIKKISFIIDADDSCKNAQEKLNGFITKIKAAIDCECEYFILPDNCNHGMAEDLLLSAASKEGLVELIKSDVYPKLEEHEESNIKNASKTKFMIYALTQNPVKTSAHIMLQQAQECINLDHEKLKDLKKFIEETFV